VRSQMVTGLTLAGGALAAVSTPAGAATPSVVPPPGDGADPAPVVRVNKTPLVRRDIRLARQVAHLRGRKLRRHYEHTIRVWPMTKLSRHYHHLRRELRVARRAAHAASILSGTLRAIAACESGGDPRTDTGNGFYGKYQFTLSTWRSVGGSGNPARAPEAEQDRRAAKLYARAGSRPWPVCGR
jgi:hypothetical protein